MKYLLNYKLKGETEWCQQPLKSTNDFAAIQESKDLLQNVLNLKYFTITKIKRELLCIYDSKNKRMTNADKMFEELGYKIDIREEYGLIRYNKDENKFIRFMLENKEIEANKIEPNGDVWILNINIELLQAINEKCKELGWIK